MGTHALKLKDSGADTVILYSTITHGANVIKEMAKVGYRPKIVSSFPLGDYFIMYRLLGELWEGAHFNALGAAALANDAPAKPILEILTKYEPKLVGKENTALAGAVATDSTPSGCFGRRKLRTTRTSRSCRPRSSSPISRIHDRRG